MARLKWRFWFRMNSNRGIIGGFVSMFVATIVIVIILVILIIASGVVKEIVRDRDNVGVQNETDVGLGNIFGYIDYQFNNITQLRVRVNDGGWEEWLEGMGR